MKSQTKPRYDRQRNGSSFSGSGSTSPLSRRNHVTLCRTSTSQSAASQRSLSTSNTPTTAALFNDFEIQLDMEPETAVSRSNSLTFNQRTAEFICNDPCCVLEPSLADDDDDEEDHRRLCDLDKLDSKTFADLELSTTPTPPPPPTKSNGSQKKYTTGSQKKYGGTMTIQNNGHYSNGISPLALPNDAPSREPTDEIDGEWRSPTSTDPFIETTGYRLTPPLANPVDMAADDELLAVADYDNGIHFVNIRTHRRRHLPAEPPHRICGVQFAREDGDARRLRVALLVYMEERWTVQMRSWPHFEVQLSVDCPTQPSVPPWARRKITVVGEVLFLLGTSENCSAIWTLDLKSMIWKTLIVERGRPATGIGINSLLTTGNFHKASVYTDFDVRRFSKLESRVVLCEAQKSQLNILVLVEPDQLVDKQTIKVKRRKNEKWIVQGPKMAVWDSENDIIVYDGSGKIFWFDGVSYRIRKIVGDIGRSEVSALEAKNGWCYVLCRHQLCVYAFHYREPDVT